MTASVHGQKGKMMRLIDADKVLKHKTDHDMISTHLIYNAPTVDAVPVRHGKWKWLSCTYDRVPKEKEYECSNCHHKTIVHGDDMPWEKYCPNCGAKMDAERKE